MKPEQVGPGARVVPNRRFSPSSEMGDGTMGNEGNEENAFLLSVIHAVSRSPALPLNTDILCAARVLSSRVTLQSLLAKPDTDLIGGGIFCSLLIP